MSRPKPQNLKFTAFLAVTIDGHIARKNGGIDFLPPPPTRSPVTSPTHSHVSVGETLEGTPRSGQESSTKAQVPTHQDMLGRMDLLVMGRGTYEVVCGLCGRGDLGEKKVKGGKRGGQGLSMQRKVGVGDEEEGGEGGRGRGQRRGERGNEGDTGGARMGEGEIENQEILPQPLPWPYSTVPLLILTSLPQDSLPPVPDPDVKVHIARDIGEALTFTNKVGCNNVWVDGGKTVRSFLQRGLIDDIILTTVGVLLGSGNHRLGNNGEHVREGDERTGLSLWEELRLDADAKWRVVACEVMDGMVGVHWTAAR